MRISDWSSDVCSSDLLGARGDPMEALARVLEIAKSGLGSHVVARELIAVSDGRANTRPVLGMFLVGAGLADSILFCRHKIYPLGLPNSLSHALTVVALILTALFGARASFLPARPRTVSVSALIRSAEGRERVCL